MRRHAKTIFDVREQHTILRINGIEGTVLDVRGHHADPFVSLQPVLNALEMTVSQVAKVG